MECQYEGCHELLTGKQRKWCSNITPPYHGMYARTKQQNGGRLISGAQARKRYGHPKIRYRASKGNSCKRCGFTAEHPAQLDVDHIDGNHANDDPANLQTLCANCHRLKTALEMGHGPHP